MGAEITPVIALAFVGVLLLIVFAFVSVLLWSEARRKEREALYKTELLKKLAETPGPGADAVLASLREEERRKHDRKREWLTLGGVLCAALGLAVLVAYCIAPNILADGVWTVGFVPLLLGLALLGQARFVMARPAGRT
jgi:hypothetical protein